MVPSLSNSADDKQSTWSKQKEEPDAPGWEILQNNRAGHTDRQDLDPRERPLIGVEISYQAVSDTTTEAE